MFYTGCWLWNVGCRSLWAVRLLSLTFHHTITSQLQTDFVGENCNIQRECLINIIYTAGSRYLSFCDIKSSRLSNYYLFPDVQSLTGPQPAGKWWTPAVPLRRRGQAVQHERRNQDTPTLRAPSYLSLIENRNITYCISYQEILLWILHYTSPPHIPTNKESNIYTFLVTVLTPL